MVEGGGFEGMAIKVHEGGEECEWGKGVGLVGGVVVGRGRVVL